MNERNGDGRSLAFHQPNDEALTLRHDDFMLLPPQIYVVVAHPSLFGVCVLYCETTLASK